VVIIQAITRSVAFCLGRTPSAPESTPGSLQLLGKLQQTTDSRRLQCHNHGDDSDQTRDPEHCSPPVADDSGVQNKNGPSISGLKLADAKPYARSQSLWTGASDHGVETQQRSASCHLSQRHDHHDDRSQTSDPEQRDPLVAGQS
jgi:hypothetical protein